MPYVRLCTSAKMNEEAVAAVRKVIGDTISVIPGKNLESTVIHIEPEAIISRGDPSNPSLFIEVRMFGPAAIGAKKAFTKNVCEELEKVLNIPQNCIVLNIFELDSWGRNGIYSTYR